MNLKKLFQKDTLSPGFAVLLITYCFQIDQNLFDTTKYFIALS